MALEDLTALFENLRNPSENTDTESVLVGIKSVYESDLTEKQNEIQAKEDALREKNEALAAAQERVGILQDKNYNLLMKSGAGNVPDDSNPKPDPDAELERAATVTFADIFKK